MIMFIFIIVFSFALFCSLSYLFLSDVIFSPPVWLWSLSLMLQAFFWSLPSLLSTELLESSGRFLCGPRVMGAPSLSLGDFQMSAPLHLPLTLASFFRASPPFRVCPAAYIWGSILVFTVQPVTLHSIPPSFINGLPTPVHPCVALSLPLCGVSL